MTIFTELNEDLLEENIKLKEAVNHIRFKNQKLLEELQFLKEKLDDTQANWAYEKFVQKAGKR